MSIRHRAAVARSAGPLAVVLLLAAAAPAGAQEIEVEAEEPVTPAGAFVRSLLIPGWGQMAAGSPHRGAVYFALEAGSIWMAVKTRQRLRDVRALEAQILADEAVDEGWRDQRLDALASLRRERENQFEDWMTLVVFNALLSAADALVAAYLQDFDEHLDIGMTDDSSLRFGLVVPVGGR